MNNRISSISAFVVIIIAAVVVGAFSVKTLTSETKVDADPVRLNVPERTVADVSEQIDTSDWITYRNKEQGFSVMYPPDWAAKQESHAEFLVSFTSPDYEPAQQLGPSVLSGAWLEVFVLDNKNAQRIDEAYIQSIKEAQRIHGGEYGRISIGGEDGVWSTVKPHGTYIAARVFRGEREYYLRLNTLDENDPENRASFDATLATFEFIEPVAEAREGQRTALTPETILLYEDEIDDYFCFGDDFNWDAPNGFVSYENLDLGYRVEVPYNASWGNELFYLEPFDEVSDEGDGWLQFGNFGGGDGCSISAREYGLRPIEHRSVEDIKTDMNGYAVKEELPLVPFTVGTSRAVGYTEFGLCEYARIEIQGIGVAANGITNNPNYLLTGECGSDMTDLKEIVASFEFID